MRVRTGIADYTQFRPLMFSIAYRMTGSVSDAEDIVQEAFLRLTRALRDGAQVTSPKAYLATVTTRLAISHLRSARVRREAYVGAWLPEPIVEGELAPATAPDPAERAEMSDSLSMAFLVLLESLTPTERAVFLLHEVFSYDYAGDRRDHRQVRAELPSDLRPRPAPHRRGQAPVRGLTRAARRGGPPVLRRGRRRRPG